MSGYFWYALNYYIYSACSKYNYFKNTFSYEPFLASSLIIAFFFLCLHLVLINGMYLPQVSSMMSWNSPDFACRDSTSSTFPFYFKSFSEPRCNRYFAFHCSNMNSEWLLTLQLLLQKCSLIAILKEILNIFLGKKSTVVFPFLVGCSNK